MASHPTKDEFFTFIQRREFKKLNSPNRVIKMKFVMEIEIGIEGIQTSLDLSNVLAKVALRVAHGHYDLHQEVSRGVLDCHGDVVGDWHIKKDVVPDGN